MTVPEFKQAPTAIDVSQLDQTAIGNQAAQDAALLVQLRRASAWVDNICRMPSTLEATLNTETKEVHLNPRDNRLTVHVDNAPIIQLQTVQYRLAPNMDYNPVDLMYVQQFESWFSVYNINSNTLSPSLTLQANTFGYYSPYRMSNLSDLPVTVQYTYVNGYMNTTLAIDANVGDTTITVKNALGAVQNGTFVIYDGNGNDDETCYVKSVSGNVITLQNPLLFAHATGTSASAIPDAIKQATILLAGYLIKNRGSGAVVMTEMGLQGVTNSYANNGSDVSVAKELLRPYMRVITS